MFRGIDLLPVRLGREWYQTSGFKELALLLGVTERSYRKTARYLNRHRRQAQGGTPTNTLRDGAESEGTAVLAFLRTESERLLEQHGFTEEGVPLAESSVLKAPASSPATLPEERIQEARRQVEQQMQKRGMPADQIQEIGSLPKALYEDPQETVNIHLDDVGVKEQKQQRRPAAAGKSPAGEAGESSSPRKRPMVQNTVARVEHQGQGFTLIGESVLAVLKFVLALLLANDLVGRRWLIFTDGQRSLQNGIESFFAWYGGSISLILDWFHLVKKCKEELSLALKGRAVRNRHLKEIVRLLWYGLVHRAGDYVKQIPRGDIKSRASLDRLVGYFDRNRGRIPCYAMRQKLGLPNSSNPVERTNNLVTSNRQKKNGMSWSRGGSLALTALTAVVLNGHIQSWLKQRVIPFAFQQAA